MLRFKISILSFIYLILMSTEIFAGTLTYERAIAVLGVPEQSTPELVTKAYRRLAMKFHPDRVGNNTKEQDFKDMKAAYEFLVGIDFKKENDNGKAPGPNWQHQYDDPEQDMYTSQTAKQMSEYEMARQKAAQDAQKGYTFDINKTLGMHGHFFGGAQDILSMLTLRMEQKNISSDLAFLVYSQTILKYGMAEILKLTMLTDELKILQELVFETTGEMPITLAIDKLVNSQLRELKNVPKGDPKARAIIKALAGYYGTVRLASAETKLKISSALNLHKVDPKDEVDWTARIEWQHVLKPDLNIEVKLRKISPLRLSAPLCNDLF
jgi:hypothetical protein